MMISCVIPVRHALPGIIPVQRRRAPGMVGNAHVMLRHQVRRNPPAYPRQVLLDLVHQPHVVEVREDPPEASARGSMSGAC